MSLAKEFKEFAMRGNVIDLAVGVVIGGAFGKIVSAFVDAVVMPVLGLLTSGVNFSELAVQIGGTADKPVLLKYGLFVQATIDFVIIAFVIFMAIRAINKLKKPAVPAAPPAPPKQEVLLEEIRDLLAKR
ncbi:MAG: large-conductance mechanosensitive channel protein MscL [Steroidobacteraceae bacterium]